METLAVIYNCLAKINNTLIVICTQKESLRNAQKRWEKKKWREEKNIQRITNFLRKGIESVRAICSKIWANKKKIVVNAQTKWIAYKPLKSHISVLRSTSQNVYVINELISMELFTISKMTFFIFALLLQVIWYDLTCDLYEREIQHRQQQQQQRRK